MFILYNTSDFYRVSSSFSNMLRMQEQNNIYFSRNYHRILIFFLKIILRRISLEKFLLSEEILFFFLLKKDNSYWLRKNLYFFLGITTLIFNKYKFTIIGFVFKKLPSQEKDSFASLQRCIREKAISTSRLTFILLEITVEFKFFKKKRKIQRPVLC